MIKSTMEIQRNGNSRLAHGSDPRLPSGYRYPATVSESLDGEHTLRLELGVWRLYRGDVCLGGRLNKQEAMEIER